MSERMQHEPTPAVPRDEPAEGTAAGQRAGATAAASSTASPATTPPATTPRTSTSPAKKPGKPRRGGALGFLRETVIVVGTALVLSLLIKTLLVQAFYIPSPSMEPTLVPGDRVLVSQLTPGPLDLRHGDVVVFKDPGSWLDPTPTARRGPVSQAVVDALTFVGVLPQDSGEHLIKRVVGMPGDTVACCDREGRVTVNGEPVEEPYVYPGNDPSDMTFEVEVPEGRLWVMGDHREASQDSRWHQDLVGSGTVPEENVVGRAVVVIWPLSRVGTLGNYPEAFAEIAGR